MGYVAQLGEIIEWCVTSTCAEWLIIVYHSNLGNMLMHHIHICGVKLMFASTGKVIILKRVLMYHNYDSLYCNCAAPLSIILISVFLTQLQLVIQD